MSLVTFTSGAGPCSEMVIGDTVSFTRRGPFASARARPRAAPSPRSTRSTSCLLYPSPSPRDRTTSRMPSSARKKNTQQNTSLVPHVFRRHHAHQVFLQLQAHDGLGLGVVHINHMLRRRGRLCPALPGAGIQAAPDQGHGKNARGGKQPQPLPVDRIVHITCYVFPAGAMTGYTSFTPGA